jgi:hypothetical protein
MRKLQAGDWVEVRSKEEILSSLDKNGRLDELPFMPQMFQYCGKRFTVFKRAHKTCDTVSGKYLGRSLSNAIHLDLRCDGQAYGGCQAACLIFWKEAWLKPVNQTTTSSSSRVDLPRSAPGSAGSCTESDVWTGTCAQNKQMSDEPRYVCQATQLLNFTTPLPWYDFRQYVEDYTSGNATLGRILRGLIYICYYYGTLAYRGRSGGPARWLYDRFQRLWGGVPYPRRRGILPPGKKAPVANLNLQLGESVRVEPLEAILKTIDANYMNRGLAFDAELVPYCGGTYPVKARVSRFIDEKTGKMIFLKTPAVMLEGAYCQSCYSPNRMFCPRSIYPWWREVWLQRIPQCAPGETVCSRRNADAHNERSSPVPLAQ